MLVAQINPVGAELFSQVNASFCYHNLACVLATCVKTLYGNYNNGILIFKLPRGMKNWRVKKTQGEITMSN